MHKMTQLTLTSTFVGYFFDFNMPQSVAVRGVNPGVYKPVWIFLYVLGSLLYLLTFYTLDVVCGKPDLAYNNDYL